MFYNSPKITLMLNETDPVHTLILRPYFYKTLSNIIFPSLLNIPKSFFSSEFPTTIV